MKGNCLEYGKVALFGELYAYLAMLSQPEKVKSEIAKIKQELNEIAGIGDRNIRSNFNFDN